MAVGRRAGTPCLLRSSPLAPPAAERAGLAGLPEHRVPRAVCRKVDERAKGVAGAAVVHVAHHGAQVRKLRLLHKVAHCRRRAREKAAARRTTVGHTPAITAAAAAAAAVNARTPSAGRGRHIKCTAAACWLLPAASCAASRHGHAPPTPPHAPATAGEGRSQRSVAFCTPPLSGVRCRPLVLMGLPSCWAAAAGPAAAAEPGAGNSSDLTAGRAGRGAAACARVGSGGGVAWRWWRGGSRWRAGRHPGRQSRLRRPHPSHSLSGAGAAAADFWESSSSRAPPPGLATSQRVTWRTACRPRGGCTHRGRLPLPARALPIAT